MAHRQKDELNSIPGTFVFDADRSRRGYALNMWCMSLMKAQNRARFLADPQGYLSEFPLNAEQRQAILDRDYNRLLELGGNIYFLSKIAAADGHSFQKIGAMMSGVTEEEFRAMMLGGGRSPHG